MKQNITILLNKYWNNNAQEMKLEGKMWKLNKTKQYKPCVDFFQNVK